MKNKLISIIGIIICIYLFSYTILFENVSYLGKIFISVGLIMVIFNAYKNLTTNN